MQLRMQLWMQLWLQLRLQQQQLRLQPRSLLLRRVLITKDRESKSPGSNRTRDFFQRFTPFFKQARASLAPAQPTAAPSRTPPKTSVGQWT